MMAIGVPTSTVSSSGTSSLITTPETGEGTSVSTLSVATDTSGSSASMVSPTALYQEETVPSVTDSPRAGMVTSVPAVSSLWAGVAAGAVAAGAGVGSATGAGAAGAGAEAGSATGAGVASAAPPRPEPSPIMAMTVPTSTVSSSGTRICSTTPETGEGTSVSTLSVATDTSGSSASTCSPTALYQEETVPSVTDSPRAGISTECDMVLLSTYLSRGCVRACRQVPLRPHRESRSEWGGHVPGRRRRRRKPPK